LLTAFVCCSIPLLRDVTNIACIAASVIILLPAGKPAYVTAFNRFTGTLSGAAVALTIAVAAAGVAVIALGIGYERIVTDAFGTAVLLN
jgi:hypothetical protein